MTRRQSVEHPRVGATWDDGCYFSRGYLGDHGSPIYGHKIRHTLKKDKGKMGDYKTPRRCPSATLPVWSTRWIGPYAS
jgi:hypothetical protein